MTVKLIHTYPPRLAFSVLRVDAYLSFLLGYPPSVRYQEFCIPLPKSANLWTALCEDRRRNLQWNEPVGRDKALFCFLMRDTLDIRRQHNLPQLTDVDYHLILCSFLTGLWETTREAHSCESVEFITSPTAEDPIKRWRTHLDHWRVSTEKDCLLRQSYFSASAPISDHILFPLSLILWHSSAITLYVPLKLLQGHGCCFNCRIGTAMTMQKNKARLRVWMESPYARIAVWNAAQISRVIKQELANSKSKSRLKLNALAVYALLKSAMVTCSYAYHTRVCPRCNGGPPIDLVDIFGAKDEDERLVKWQDRGEGLASWGGLFGPSVCECKFMELANWFREALASDKGVEMEFIAFLKGLGKE